MGMFNIMSLMGHIENKQHMEWDQFTEYMDQYMLYKIQLMQMF